MSKFEYIVMRWMNPEPVIQSEVNQKSKYTLKYIYEIQKMVLMNLFTEKNGDQMQRMNLWTPWGKERVEQIQKAVLTYIHYHVKNR